MFDEQTLAVIDEERKKYSASRSEWLRAAVRAAKKYGVLIPPVFRVTPRMMQQCYPLVRPERRKELVGWYFAKARYKLTLYHIFGNTADEVSVEICGPYCSKREALLAALNL